MIAEDVEPVKLDNIEEVTASDEAIEIEELALTEELTILLELRVDENDDVGVVRLVHFKEIVKTAGDVSDDGSGRVIKRSRICRILLDNQCHNEAQNDHNIQVDCNIHRNSIAPKQVIPPGACTVVPATSFVGRNLLCW